MPAFSYSSPLLSQIWSHDGLADLLPLSPFAYREICLSHSLNGWLHVITMLFRSYRSQINSKRTLVSSHPFAHIQNHLISDNRIYLASQLLLGKFRAFFAACRFCTSSVVRLKRYSKSIFYQFFANCCC